MRYITLLVFVVFVNIAFAQKDTLVYYLKDSGAIADNMANSDYKLVVLPPDMAVDETLWILKAYLPDGSLKFIAGSISSTLPLTLQGYYTEYYPDGNKKLVRYFNDGRETGYKTDYYPNGRVQLEFRPDGTGGGTKKEYYPFGTLKMEHYPTGNHHANETEYYSNGKPSRKDLIDSLGRGSRTEYYETGATKSLTIFGKRAGSSNVTAYFPNGNLYFKKNFVPLGDGSLETDYEECRDSTGKILAQRGKGFWMEYNGDFTLKTRQGKVVKSLPDSIWKISYSSTEGEMDTYKKGDLIDADPYIAKNNVPVYEQVPEFPGGLHALNNFLSTNIKYPKDARANHIQGRVVLRFVVERDGSLSDIKVVKGIGSGCDEEALRVLKLSPRWKPGMQQGKQVRVQYSVPINFTLGN